MKIRKNAPWTEDDNRRLEGFVETGVSIARAAIILKRSITGVRDQARKIGKPFPAGTAVRRAREAKIEAAVREISARSIRHP